MARQIGSIRARIEYTGVAGVVAMLRAMPLERAVRFGARLGTVAAELDRPNRPIAMRNLEIAFPDLDRARRLEIVRGVYRNWGRMLAEWAHMGSLDRAALERYVSYEGRENWDEGVRLSNGRGALVLTAHFGNFELMNVAHSMYGNRVAILHRPLRNPLMDAAVCALRVRFGNRIIERKNGAMETIRLMRKNWHIAVALDLDVRDGVFVDFFGLPACTSDGVARLAMVTGAPVVPCFMIRDGASTRHTIAIQPPLELVHGRDRAAVLRENTQRCVAAIEKMIRLHPDHWNWIHPRWKTRPPGEPRFY